MIFKKSRTPKRTKFKQKSLKNRMFVGTSISEAFWKDSIELPQGGATAASPFVCKNVGGLPCIEGLHLQDCIAEGTWGNESPHFGYNLPRLCYEFKTLVRNTFLPKEPRKRRTFSKNRSQNPLKSRPGASKIEPRAIQNAIFQDI